MTLTTHAIVGAAAAALVPANPLAGFALGFASHFAIDAIPHWDYEPRSLKTNRAHPLETYVEEGDDMADDILFVSGDALLGLFLSAVIFSVGLFHVPFAAVFAGAVGALAPDGLHFLYFMTHEEMMIPLERFHNWVQTYSPLEVPAWVGAGLQCALIVAVIAAFKLLTG